MQLDEVFRRYVVAQGGVGTMIACLYTGENFPSYCAPMPRDPIPNLGAQLNQFFHQHVREAIQMNQAVHDGAIMIGRRNKDSEYQITGWSFRLFAPIFSSVSEVNRGSAYNSCLAISCVDGVDSVYLHSSGRLHFFENGKSKTIFSEVDSSS